MQGVEVPLAEIPLHVHCGSIVVLAPPSQWAMQLYPWQRLEVRVYPGGDGEFLYFNDDGTDRFSLRDGLFTTIRFEWKDAAGQLVIGARNGKYDGMASNITMNIVLVKEGHGVGVNETADPDKTVTYV